MDRITFRPFATLLIALLLAAVALPHCSFQWFGLRPAPRGDVLLAHNDKAYRIAYLIRDLDLRPQILPQSPMAYSAPAHGLIIIGRDFPHDKAQRIFTFAHNYYDGLRYVAFHDHYERRQRPLEANQLYLGAATDDAVHLGLRAWTRGDFDAAAALSNQDDFIAFIENRSSRSSSSNGSSDSRKSQ